MSNNGNAISSGDRRQRQGKVLVIEDKAKCQSRKLERPVFTVPTGKEASQSSYGLRLWRETLTQAKGGLTNTLA
jgi:hypothetical protein